MARNAVKFDYDLIVIGSGAAGSTAAFAAAKQKLKVALIEADSFGGESPNWGDIPTKALLHAAQLYDEAIQGTRFGIRSSMLSYNFPSIQQWRAKAVRRTGAADNRRHYTSAGIDTFAGNAHFLSPHEISVNRKHLTARNFLIATGTTFDKPDIYGIETVRYHTPKTVLERNRVPRSLFIVGSDSTGMELAQLFATFGTKVYIAEKSARLLPNEDPEVGDLLEKHFAQTKGITCLTQTQVAGLEKKGLGMRVSYIRGNASKSVQVDEILFTGNRIPATDLGLENAIVDYSPTGITVDANLRTSAKHIYAAGGVLGGDSIATHTSMLQARAAVHNILSPRKAKPPADTSATPRITYTFPGVASIGLSENDCIKRDLSVRQVVAPLSLVARSNTSDFTAGFVKLIADHKGVLLGATVVAPHAAEISHELALALYHGMTAGDIAEMPHAFLSWSEAVRSAAARLV